MHGGRIRDGCGIYGSGCDGGSLLLLVFECSQFLVCFVGLFQCGEIGWMRWGDRTTGKGNGSSRRQAEEEDEAEEEEESRKAMGSHCHRSDDQPTRTAASTSAASTLSLTLRRRQMLSAAPSSQPWWRCCCSLVVHAVPRLMVVMGTALPPRHPRRVHSPVRPHGLDTRPPVCPASLVRPAVLPVAADDRRSQHSGPLAPSASAVP